MSKSVEELTAVVYRYYPRGVTERESRADPSEESRRLVEARLRAAANDKPWRAFLRRLADNFPAATVQNKSLHLPMGDNDACYSGEIYLPTNFPGEHHHVVGFLVSFVVPCCVLYSRRCVDMVGVNEARVPVERNLDIYIGDTMYVTPTKVMVLPPEEAPRRLLDATFDPSPDEEPYFAWLASAIEATFGCERLPPEIGKVLVPDVATGGRAFGEATLYDCLFSENW